MNAIDRVWMAPAPATRLAMIRVLVGLYGTIYLLIRTPHLLSYALDDLNRFEPVGIVSLAPSATLPWIHQVLVVVVVALSVPFLLGFKHRVLAPIYAGLLLWVLTYSNSWGKILHTDNMLMLYVAILAVTPSADALSWDARGRPDPGEGEAYGWPIKLMALLCVLVYLLAGIAKLRNSGMEFVTGETLRNYVAFGAVRKAELGSQHSPLGVALLPYPGLFAVLAGVSMLLELTGPIAVVHRRFGKLWALGVWGFHVGVLGLMAIGFMFQLFMVAFAPFFECERLLERLPERWRARLSVPAT